MLDTTLIPRVNSSAVETIFSQLKHTTSSNLIANYESAKATLLTRVQCKGKDAYRSAALYDDQICQENENHHNSTCTCINTFAHSSLYNTMILCILVTV